MHVVMLAIELQQYFKVVTGDNIWWFNNIFNGKC